MEKKKIPFKERFKAFREYWKENWKQDCLFGFLCLALGFCVARCTSEENSAFADEVIPLEAVLIEPEDVGGAYLYTFSAGGFYLFDVNELSGLYVNVDNTSLRSTIIGTGFLPDYYVIYVLEAGAPLYTFTLSSYFDTGYYLFYVDERLYSQIAFYFLSDVNLVYELQEYTLPDTNIDISNTDALYNIFSGSRFLYHISEYTSDGLLEFETSWYPSLNITSTRLYFDDLYRLIPEEIRLYEFNVGYEEYMYIYPNNVQNIDISKLAFVGFPYIYGQGTNARKCTISVNGVVNGVSVNADFRLLENGSVVNFDSSSTLGYVFDTINYMQITPFTDYASSPFKSILSCLPTMYISYGSQFDLGYEVGYYNALSMFQSDYNQAFLEGYNSSYNTIDTLSPNYVAGYNNGLSNADGSWVLSPVNAVNTLMSLELFSVGDFHFKLSYLVYLTFGGLLIGVLCRFLFHS